jgi:hypothetical protein
MSSLGKGIAPEREETLDLEASKMEEEVHIDSSDGARPVDGSDNALNYLMKPFANINETKDVLQKLGTVTIIRKQMVFSDAEFERRFKDSLEPKMRSRMILFGVISCIYAIYSMFFFNFFGPGEGQSKMPLIYVWGTNANKLYNIGCIINLFISLLITLVSWKRNMFRHRLEQFFQYSLILLLIVDMMFVNIWRVSCLTAGDKKPSDVLRDAFKDVSDPYPDADLVMLLTGCVLYLAVVADMRFRRLVWICIVTFIVYAIAVIYYKLPRYELITVPAGDDNAEHFNPSNSKNALQRDAKTGPSKFKQISQVVESPDSMQNWLLALQLGIMFLISLFGKTQLELLQRQNFLELELAQKRIDVLEKTINAIDSKNQPHSHVEQTHKRIKDAERIIEKLRLMNASEATAGSNAHLQELATVLDVLRETEKTMTIMDFQKEVLIGPIKTGIEYKEEEVMNWLEKLVGSNQGDTNPGVFGPQSSAPPSLIPISAMQGGSVDFDLGISAKSLMKRLGVEWQLDPAELERTLKANRATDLNALCLTARALITPFLNNVLLGVTPDILAGFAKAMSDAYLDVPFHRGDHAAMVTHHASVLLELTGVRKHLGGLDRFAVVLAALGHDVNHFGRSNPFLVDTRHELALRYNDQSVLENFHASRTFEIIRSSSQTNILVTLSRRDEKRLRNRVIQLILATDATHHFNHLSELRMRLLGSTSIFDDPEVTDSDRRIGMTAVMNAADHGFFAMPIDVHTQWMSRLAEEMAQQGDNERALNLSISPMCDRASQELPGMSLGLMKLLVMPLFDEIANLARKANPGTETETELDVISEALSGNQAYWESKRRDPRPHAGSFDMFIPVPKSRTATSTSGDVVLQSSEGDPSSPPSLVAVDSPFSVSRNSNPRAPVELVVEGSESDDDGDDDDGPPVLPFSAVHRI